jgi:hypothetical protein
VSKGIRRGFLAAGLVNILGMLAVNRLFTNPELARLDPRVFAPESQALIMLWGAAYIAVGRAYPAAAAAAAVFALEKALYFLLWLRWLAAHASELATLLGRDPLTGLFYASYGLVDLGFGVFFCYAFLRAAPGAAAER